MPCDLTSSRTRNCKNKLAGQSKIYFNNFVEDPFTIVAGEATAVNPLLTEVYEYELEGDGNTLVESLVSDRNTGTSVNTQTLTTILKGLSAANGAELNLMAYGYPQVVVKDRNGEYHSVAYDDGMDFTVEKVTGGAKTDLTGYTLTGVATTGALSAHLDAATVTAFLLLVV